MEEQLEDMTDFFCKATKEVEDLSTMLSTELSYSTPVSTELPLSPLNKLYGGAVQQENNVSMDSGYNANPYQYVNYILYCRVVVAICAFGLVGNVFNLFILIPKGVQYSLGRIEKFAYSGLIALAVSDMMFCLVTIPHAFVNLEAIHDSVTFDLIYFTYKDAVINVFTLSSTWLTVTLAVGRYLAICHPLRARELIGMTFAKRSLGLVFTLCVLFNIPRFWTLRVAGIHCENSTSVYFTWEGPLKGYKNWDLTYTWTYFVLGILLPLCLLIFCNCHLILALRRSRDTRRQMRASHFLQETNNNMTLVLVAIVVMYIVLFSPAELINFFGHQIKVTKEYNLAVAVVNMLQSLNFSLNFILYSILNLQFRRSAVALVRCSRLANQQSRRYFRPSSSSTTVTGLGPQANGRGRYSFSVA